MIKGLHHNAYRCRDSEETRCFYEDFLGLPLVHSLEIGATMTGRGTQVLHTFYQMETGRFLPFLTIRRHRSSLKTSATLICTLRWRSNTTGCRR